MLRRLAALVQHRELILRLAGKDLKVRYKSPWLGFLWALLVPVFMMLILTVVFSLFMRIQVGEMPFWLFLVTALFPWNFVALSLSTGTTSVVESGSLIRKVYFPREAIPVSVVMANLVNFLLAEGILLLILLIGLLLLSLLFILRTFISHWNSPL